jgi:hypothetical protein
MKAELGAVPNGHTLSRPVLARKLVARVALSDDRR